MKIRTLLAAALVLAIHGGASAADGDPAITVFKSPWCGCCAAWADAIKKAGYSVRIIETEDLDTVRRQAGVPETMAGCHTAVTDGEKPYVLEGHVPLEAMKKLFAEKPDVRGIAVPGMPQGSLGMGYDPAARYTVFAIGKDETAAPAVFYEAGK